jgi:hypothetical protein
VAFSRAPDAWVPITRPRPADEFDLTEVARKYHRGIRVAFAALSFGVGALIMNGAGIAIQRILTPSVSVSTVDKVGFRLGVSSTLLSFWIYADGY